MVLGNQVDNSKLTPEFNQGGQGQQATADDNNQLQNQAGNVTPQDNGQVTEPVQPTGNEIQVGEETFESQEALIEAYNNMKANLEARNNSYKELQGAYTKSRQEIAMRNKMARPANTGMQQPLVQPIMPPNIYNNQYRQPAQPYVNQPYGGVNPQMVNGYNNIYGMNTMARPQEQTSAVVNEAMINMAVENKIIELKSQDPDFDEVAGELWTIMDTDDYFSKIRFTDPEMAKNSINAAYQLAKQKVEAAKANLKINNAKKEAYYNKQQKVLNNDVSNVANKGKGQTEKTDAEKIKDSILGAKPQIF